MKIEEVYEIVSDIQFGRKDISFLSTLKDQKYAAYILTLFYFGFSSVDTSIVSEEKLALQMASTDILGTRNFMKGFQSFLTEFRSYTSYLKKYNDILVLLLQLLIDCTDEDKNKIDLEKLHNSFHLIDIGTDVDIVKSILDYMVEHEVYEICPLLENKIKELEK